MNTNANLAASILSAVATINAPALVVIGLWLALAVLAAVVAGRMFTPADLAAHAKSTKLLTPAWEQVVRDFYRSTLRVLVLCVGRGGRKTSTLALICVFEAYVRHREHERRAMKGTRIFYAIVAPAVRQAREAVRAVRAVLDELGIEYALRGETDIPEIDLIVPGSRCQATITVLVADPATVRGFAVAWLGFTEASWFPTEGVGTLADIIRAIRPRMAAQFPGYRIVMESTPGPPEWFRSNTTRPSMRRARETGRSTRTCSSRCSGGGR